MTAGLTRRAFASGLAVSALATIPAARVVRAQGKTLLKARMERDIQVLDPGFMVGGTEITVQYAVMPRLAHIVARGELFTWAPSEYVRSLEQVDPTHIAFTLQPGFQWTNGYGELTAEDVKFTFERMLQSDWKDKWLALDRVDVTGELSGTIVLKHAFPALWLTTLAAGAGCLMCKRATAAVGGKYTTEIPATCGPYVIGEWRPKQRLVLVRDPAWRGPKPDFDEVRFLNVEDNSAAELAYEAGEVDVTKVATSSLPRYTRNPPPDTRVTVAGNLQYAWLGMNTEHPKLSDIRVRRAIQHAVDVDSIIEAAYFGTAPKAHGIVPPGVLGRREATGYRYDVAQAKALVAEAGAGGLALELKTLNQQDRVVAAQIIQANLADIGIEVKVIPLDSGPFWSIGRENKGDDWKDSQLWIMRFGGSLDPMDYFQWFTRSQIGNWNWERWTTPEFEELYASVASETDDAKRVGVFLRMQQIMEETGAYVFLTHEPEAFVHRADLKAAIVPTGEMDFRRFGRIA